MESEVQARTAEHTVAPHVPASSASTIGHRMWKLQHCGGTRGVSYSGFRSNQIL